MRKLFLFLTLTYIFCSCNPDNPSPNCTFTYSSWSGCTNGIQTRTYTVSPAGCAVTPPTDSLTRACTSIVSTPGSGVTYYGVTYTSIVLGNGQEWLVENLNTTKYANGDPVTFVPQSQWGQTIPSNTEAFIFSPATSERLYNYYAVVDSRHLCPPGWHVPSDAEWTALTDYLGGEDVAGGKMKATGIGTYPNWYNPNQDATNEIGFSALPVGNMGCTIGGWDANVNRQAHWWSTTDDGSGAGAAWARLAIYNSGSLSRGSECLSRGLSVRCIKD
jgi:uncharacterized protein (TIGR02145 family)